MHCKHPAWKSSPNHFFAAVIASTVLFTAGCANMATTAAVSDSLSGSAAVVSGHVHGGSQPISGAIVTLNTAGSNKPGTPGVVLATTTTDSGGMFSFTKNTPNGGTTYPNSSNIYTCPATGNPLVYLMAKGGNYGEQRQHGQQCGDCLPCSCWIMQRDQLLDSCERKQKSRPSQRLRHFSNILIPSMR